MVPSTPFKNSAGVYEWLSRFFNLEKGLDRRDFNLDCMKILAEMAGHPEKCAPSFHVAGSKGKGSVTGMIASILEASGVKTARYSSPHVNDFRERIMLGSAFFGEDVYVQAGMRLKKIEEKYNHAGNEEPSFFELCTLWFFLCSSLAKCDAMAVETGMGGRLDATNILDPLVSVITPIELEHTEVLGNTIAAIAGEKAGIIKPLKPLVLAGQENEALEVFKRHASQRASPLIYFPERAELQNVHVDKNGTTFTLQLHSLVDNTKSAESEKFTELFVPMPGEVQAKNAGLAVLALRTAFPKIQEKAIRAGLSSFTLPARFERVSEKPLFIVDGAHTKQSVDLCLKTFTALYGDGGILIFGCAAEKDVNSMAELCAPHFSSIVITKPGTYKISKPEEILAAFMGAAKKLQKPPEIIFMPETAKAIKTAKNLALEQGLPLLGTGSFYLAGEIRSYISSSVIGGKE